MLNCLLSDLANIEYNNVSATITKKNAEKWTMITTHYLWYTFIEAAKNKKNLSFIGYTDQHLHIENLILVKDIIYSTFTFNA